MIYKFYAKSSVTFFAWFKCTLTSVNEGMYSTFFSSSIQQNNNKHQERTSQYWVHLKERPPEHNKINILQSEKTVSDHSVKTQDLLDTIC